MTNSPILLQGAQTRYQGEVHPRLEINKFIEDHRFFSLFVLASDALLARRWDTDDLSYYQLSGIHDWPRHPWNGATRHKLDNYCQHGNVLFLPWHRAYVLLFEQAIQAEAVTIAGTYTTPDKQEWVEAAYKLRLPYWDFGLLGNALPPSQFIADKTVTITIPDGTTIKHPNPLATYTFPTGQDDPTAAILSGTTFRGKNWEQTLENWLQNRRDELYTAILGQNTWECFSTRAACHGPAATKSLETIHDDMHRDLGGTMASMSGSAFDPISWIFHCQIDHIFTLWHVLHPPKEVPLPPEFDKKELEPFWRDAQHKWLPSEILSTERFRYTYPEFVGIDIQDPRSKSYFQDIVHYFYRNGESPVPPQYQTRHIEIDRKQVIHKFEAQRWVAHVRCKAYEVAGPFSVLLFFGKGAELPADSKAWLHSPHLVGSFSVFVREDPQTCANCMSHREELVEGYVQLDKALLKADKDSVQEHLRTKLFWHVIKTGTGNYESVLVPSLEVLVKQVTISSEAGDRTLHWGESVPYPEITKGRCYQY